MVAVKKKKTPGKISIERIYKVYINSKGRNDPSIPTRPAGQRPAPIRDPNRPATSFFSQPFGNNAFNRGGISISAGFGFFPVGVTFVSN